MNRYPWWKYAIIVVALLIGTIYTLPNFFGEAPAVQVSSGKATIKVGPDAVGRVEAALKQAGLTPDFVQFDGNSVKARFGDIDTQTKARDALLRAFNPNPADPGYIVALNLLPRSPAWLTRLHALPMYLGLDLRGGVHFLMQVDMKAAITKRAESVAGDVRTALREKNIRHAGIARNGNEVEVRFRDRETLTAALAVLNEQQPDMLWVEGADGADLRLTGSLKPEAARAVQDQALKQNITTLHNRINELGVAEPVIQQQGADRVVVQLPGVQDPAKAKDIIGRTATLEVRMVEAHLNSDPQVRDYNPTKIEDATKGMVPPGTELLYSRRDGRGEEPLLLSKQVIFTGDNLTGADATIDQQNSGSVVSVTLDAKGGAAMKAATREGVKRRMAVVLIEKGKPEVLTAPTIQTELSNRFQITGMRSPEEANDLALLMRAGSLAAPMDIIEERTIGPSLGAENIAKGFDSVLYGFIAIAVFMCAYYLLFGLFSTVALGVNLLFLVAILSMMQATLTLPGMAAIALVLGMAIDSNVLINERVREELRSGASPQAAISAGYERAWGTILDSNVTTLIAGLALLAFGSGPVRGFAIVHCLGILTSMFSAVFFSRGLVNLWYGRQKKLKSVSIGQVWKPDTEPTAKA
ncbi:protein translocase subunit SecD [Methylibium rhizosphaerae]|uniref:protein translocase subunit SecD n=1 Tax=Methylibium rhizosphaerae TaxID=2570323 RepID=UPI00112E1847|nr:protein translocase subunit SecD [Methylibium rhizosphaerae]